LLKLIIRIIYRVNDTISISDAYNPFNRHPETNNNPDTRNSAAGISHAIHHATGAKTGDSAI
jgi:hypothetical protein